MGSMDVRFLGSGDTFGSGGRLHTCIHVRSEQTTFHIDCCASSLIAMKRFGAYLERLDACGVAFKSYTEPFLGTDHEIS